MDSNVFSCLSDSEEACSSKKASEEQAMPPGKVDGSERRMFGIIVYVYCTTTMHPKGERWEAEGK